MQLFRRLLNSQQSIYRAAPLLALITFLPSLAVAGIAYKLFQLAGHDPSAMLPSFDMAGWGLVIMVVLGPFFETLLLAGGIWLISRFTESANLISIISAIAWGIFHSLQAPLWFIGVVWPFFVFSRAYLAWRPTGKSNAIGIAWLTHAIHNSLAVGLALITT